MSETRHHPGKGHHRASVRSVDWSSDLDSVRALFHAYRDWLADHQDEEPASQARVKAGLELIDRLVSGLPGEYGPPTGDILLWEESGKIVACGALRKMEPGVGEAKRVSVAAEYRGKEFGAVFVRALLRRADELGYETLRVDTLPTMSAAIEFYRDAGFRTVPPFWPHPVAGALFFERSLRGK